MFKRWNLAFAKIKIGLVRLKIRELAAERSWTIKELAEDAQINYNTMQSYARHQGMNMVDLTVV
ncbi:MAG: helix-turn-helix transcriptional regulator [Nostoc sp.]|uniref:helix-turn-helix domain-containing protein n=1 Tax=Nostoc sp. TaxID=1180 RepID=UPI002FFCF408